MTEKALNQKIMTNLKRLLCNCTRIENSVTHGIPDINICHNGVEFWIESKIVREKRVAFRNSQVAWITIRTGFGGRVFAFASDSTTGRLLVYHGSQVFELSTLGGNIDMVKPYAIFEKPWDFKEILRLCMEARFPVKMIEMISNTY